MFNIIYHYCGIDAFMKIMQRRCIWLSNIFYFNDFMEHLWFRNLVKKEVLHRFSNRNTNSADEVISRQCYEALIAALYSRSGWEYYAACASKNDDSLSQWRAYADDGHGFAIGFDRQYFKEVGDEPDKRLLVLDVEYDLNKQTAMALKMGRNFEESIQGIAETRIEFILDNFRSAIGLVAVQVKNPKFAEEDEVRIVLRPPPGNTIDEVGGPVFHQSGNLIVPHYELTFEHRAVKNIVFGPKNDASLNRDSVTQLLRNSGYDADNFDVNESKATYR